MMTRVTLYLDMPYEEGTDLFDLVEEIRAHPGEDDPKTIQVPLKYIKLMSQAEIPRRKKRKHDVEP